MWCSRRALMLCMATKRLCISLRPEWHCDPARTNKLLGGLKLSDGSSG
jgi:hypothetical protein